MTITTIERVRRIPFVRLVIPFLLGIIFEFWFLHRALSAYLFIIPLCAIFLLMFVIPAAKKYTNRWIWGCAIFILMFAFGVGIMQNKQHTTKIPTNNKLFFSTTITNKPEARERFTKIQATINAYRDTCNTWININEKSILYIENDSIAAELKIGDCLIINASFLKTPPPQNPEEFDYAQYLARRGIYTSAFLRSDDYKITENKKMFFAATIQNIQDFIFNSFKNLGIEGEELAVLRALIIGDKQLLDEDLRNTYSSSGAMHVLAVSGLHVGLVYFVLNLLLSFLNRKRVGRIIKSLIILLVLWMYAAIAGFAPSVCRACVMFSFVIVGAMFGRKTDIYNSLSASALLLCIINPYSIFEVGFQLSYCAVLAIVYFQPIISKTIYIKNKILYYILSLAAVSVAAQIGTAAISIFYFHQFPNYFIITNILIIPIVTVIMYLIAITLLLSWIPFVGEWFGKLLDSCLWMSNQITKNVEALPYSLSENLYINKWHIAVIAVFIILLAIYIEIKNRKILFAVFACAIIFFGISTIQNVQRRNQQKFIVYATKNSTFVRFVNGNNALDIRDIENIPNAFDFNTKNHSIKLGICNIRTAVLHDSIDDTDVVNHHKKFFWFGNKSIKFADENEIAQTQNPLEIDFLIISKSAGRNANLLLNCYKPKQLIIDASMPIWIARQWIAEAEIRDIKHHNVRENGAFVLD